MVRHAPYADHLVRFEPTLSAVNLAPSEASIDRARDWGYNSVDPAIPLTSALLEPTWWECDRAVGPGAGPAAGPASVAWPMSAVMGAIHGPRNRFQRWRDRHLT